MTSCSLHASSALPDTPVMAYYAGLPGTSYDWAYTPVTQSNAGTRELPWPRGKVLGGSSAMNGMYHIRPSKVEVDAWSSLIGSDSLDSLVHCFDFVLLEENGTGRRWKRWLNRQRD